MKRKAIAVTGLLIADIIITFVYWQYEANPLGIAMGRLDFTLVKIGAIGLFWVGYWAMRNTPKISHILTPFYVYANGGLYGMALVSNLWVILR